MKQNLTISQKKNLVVGYLFGLKEVNRTTYRSFYKKGLVGVDCKLTSKAIQIAIELINQPVGNF